MCLILNLNETIVSIVTDYSERQHREVYFLIGIDDDHKPLHTMRVCSDWRGAVEERDGMSKNHAYHDVLICQEVRKKNQR